MPPVLHEDTGSKEAPAKSLAAVPPEESRFHERRVLDRSLASWDAGGMTQGARRLIEQFDALPEQERSEVLAELARRVGLSPHDLPQDDDLLAAADQLFVELDRRESTE